MAAAGKYLVEPTALDRTLSELRLPLRGLLATPGPGWHHGAKGPAAVGADALSGQAASAAPLWSCRMDHGSYGELAGRHQPSPMINQWFSSWSIVDTRGEEPLGMSTTTSRYTKYSTLIPGEKNQLNVEPADMGNLPQAG